MEDRAPDLSPAHAHQPLGLEDAQRLAQRRPADLELVEQILLLGEQLAIGDLTVEDAAAQLVGHDLGDVGGPEVGPADRRCRRVVAFDLPHVISPVHCRARLDPFEANILIF